jgi:hypothetical protein
MFINVGQPGCVNDAQIWDSSKLKQALDSGSLNLPQDSPDGVSYHFIADDIFPLGKRMMKPYARTDDIDIPEKIFNYRLGLTNIFPTGHPQPKFCYRKNRGSMLRNIFVDIPTFFQSWRVTCATPPEVRLLLLLMS